MDKDTLFGLHKQMCREGLAIMIQKNSDYCGDVDTLTNFMVCEQRGNASAEIGILIRVDDKISRLSNILKKDSPAVKDESARDTIIDVINYMVLLQAVLIEKKGEVRTEPTFGSCFYCVNDKPPTGCGVTKTSSVRDQKYVCDYHVDMHNKHMKSFGRKLEPQEAEEVRKKLFGEEGDA